MPANLRQKGLIVWVISPFIGKTCINVLVTWDSTYYNMFCLSFQSEAFAPYIILVCGSGTTDCHYSLVDVRSTCMDALIFRLSAQKMNPNICFSVGNFHVTGAMFVLRKKKVQRKEYWDACCVLVGWFLPVPSIACKF